MVTSSTNDELSNIHLCGFSSITFGVQIAINHCSSQKMTLSSYARKSSNSWPHGNDPNTAGMDSANAKAHGIQNIFIITRMSINYKGDDGQVTCLFMRL
jgi:hypothetical protein